MVYVLTWNLRKAVETAKDLVNAEGADNILVKWFGKENWEKLEECSRGDTEGSYEWVRGVFLDKMDEILTLLQTLANETQDNPLVQRRLKAVGFTPINNPE